MFYTYIEHLYAIFVQYFQNSKLFAVPVSKLTFSLFRCQCLYKPRKHGIMDFNHWNYDNKV